MLQRLLQLMVESEGSRAIHELAARLDVNGELVETMIEQLVRLGYLQATAPACTSAACRSCCRAESCSAQPRARLWSVTEKGMQWVRQHSA